MEERLSVIETLNRFVMSVDIRDATAMRAQLMPQVDFDYRELGIDMPRDADAFVRRSSRIKRRHSARRSTCSPATS